MKTQMESVYKPSPYEWYDYDPMIESFGTVLLKVEDEDYQGDTRVLLQSDGKYGHLIFGWGSCSGCDALQACRTFSDLNALAKEMYDSIKWFETASEAFDWFRAHDWEGDYSWHANETREYVTKAIEMLYALEASQ